MSAADADRARLELEARTRRMQRLTRLEDALSEVLALVEGMTGSQRAVLESARGIVSGMRVRS